LICKALATKFVANGVKVALGSRSGIIDNPPGSIKVKVDVTKPAEVSAAFAKSESEFGAPVNIVVYNGQYTSVNTPSVFI
jgi:NAD(P)-dependent dehydrogenase (short-subunit alcohol dehydrogenase family)